MSSLQHGWLYSPPSRQIRVSFDHSWGGDFYKDSPVSAAENGQWTFLHAHPSGAAKGSASAVIHRTAENDDIFIGWQTSWNASRPSCWTESKARDHWWKTVSASYMLYLLDSKAGSRKESVRYGYKASCFIVLGALVKLHGHDRFSAQITIQIGGSKTSSCVEIIEKV